MTKIRASHEDEELPASWPGLVVGGEVQELVGGEGGQVDDVLVDEHGDGDVLRSARSMTASAADGMDTMRDAMATGAMFLSSRIGINRERSGGAD